MVSATLRLASSSLLRSAARASSTALPRAAPQPLRVAVASSKLQAQSPLFLNAARGYASGGGLSHQEIQNRILDVLKSFEKVDPSKVRL